MKNKNSKFALSFLACFTLTVGALVVAAKAVESIPFKQGRVEGRSITFEGSEETVKSVDIENRSIVIEGTFTDGSSAYMKVVNYGDVSNIDYTITLGNGYSSEIYFYQEQECINEFRFQQLDSMIFYHDKSTSNERYCLYNGYLDNGESDIVEGCDFLSNSNHTTTNFTSAVRRLRIFPAADPIVVVSKVILNYTCSYSFEEPIKTVTIYASNDFHGYIEQDATHAGLKAWGTYFKEKGELDNTILLDQGDSWQGSIYSNMNHGNLIQDVMCYAGFDARTVGNHDFDWGVNAIKENALRSFTYDEKTYTMPTLGANVYNYTFDSKTWGNKVDWLQDTTVCTLENGLKVGVVGVIGDDQITSINTLYMKETNFKPHVNIIKEKAAALRESGCDIVICSIHAGIKEGLNNSETWLTNKNLGAYVDLVLGAHTHKEESYVDDNYPNVHMYQFYRNGEQFGKVTLTYNIQTNKVIRTEYARLSAYDIKNSVKTNYDPVIENLVDSEITTINTDPENVEVLANNVTGDFDSYVLAPNLMAKAVYDFADSKGENLDFVYVNQARAALPSSSFTYADLYKAFPFDNQVFVIEMSMMEVYREVMKYNNVYFGENFTNRNIDVDDTTTKFKVGVLDYLAFHSNVSRNYDYFPDNNGNYIKILEDKENNILNYRDMLKNWLKTNGYNSGKTLNSNDFNSSLDSFNRESFVVTTPSYQKTVTFDLNYGEETTYANRVYNYNAYLHTNTPVDPTRENFTFTGWFTDSYCNERAEWIHVTSNMTVYAGWGLNARYTTGRLFYDKFAVGSEETTVKAYNPQGLNVDVTFEHGPIGDASKWYEFKIPDGSFFKATAPTGYKFEFVEVHQYSTHDENLSFYKGNSVVPENEIIKVRDTNYAVGENEVLYYMNVDNDSFYISELLDGYDTSIYHIYVTLIKLS